MTDENSESESDTEEKLKGEDTLRSMLLLQIGCPCLVARVKVSTIVACVQNVNVPVLRSFFFISEYL